MTPPYPPQIALELAVRNALRAELNYADGQCERMLDGRPPPSTADVLISVWSPGERSSGQRNHALDEVYNISVTATIKLQKYPRDRWVEARDELTLRLDDIRALLHRDSMNHAIINAANVLAGRGTDDTRRIGFVEGLAFAGLDRWQLVSGAWFASKQDTEAGIMQTANFNKARLIQGIARAK